MHPNAFCGRARDLPGSAGGAYGTRQPVDDDDDDDDEIDDDERMYFNVA